MFHAYAVKFNVTGILKNFTKFFKTKQSLSEHESSRREIVQPKKRNKNRTGAG
jgi:hypothetical protein